MKNYIYILGIIFMASCSSKVSIPPKTLIGRLSVAGTRNVESNPKYVLLKSYSGASDKELLSTTAKSLEEAIDQTVKKTPGGEYMTNLKVYQVRKKDGIYFAVEGDVYGQRENANINGFRVGDRVTWKSKSLLSKVGASNKFPSGIIKALKDEKTCYVQLDDSEKIIEISYDELAK
jgi:hypothetical protein